MASSATMQVQVLLLFCLLAEEAAATKLCLADGITSDKRKDVTMDGRTMPLTIFHYEWDSALVIQDIFKILVEEVLGLNVEYNGSSWSTTDALYAIAGCAFPDKGRGCSAGLLGPLVALEAWYGENEKIIGEFQEAWPAIAPVDVGSTGYHSFESIFVSSHELTWAQEERVYLDFYKSYNASRPDNSSHHKRKKNQPDRYFDSIYNISRDKLKPLNETTMWTTVFETYVNVTGDTEGVKYVDGKMRAHSEDEHWWFAPTCRDRPEACIPVITGGSGWHHDAIMQKAAWYQFPLGLAVAASTDDYFLLPYNYSILYYWWVPDIRFLDKKPTAITFPRSDPGAWERGDMRTASSSVKTVKWAHPRLEYNVHGAFVLLTRLSLSFQQAEGFLKEMSEESINSSKIACRWLKTNDDIWRDWMPDEIINPCLNGSYQPLGNKSKCHDCAPGFYCPDATTWNVMRRNRCPPGTMCPKGTPWPLPCGYGKYNNLWGAASCEQCPSGYYGDETGADKCHGCPRGWHQKENGSKECNPCPVGTFAPAPGSDVCMRCPTFSNIQTTTLGSGSTEVAACVCPAGFKMTVSKECVACDWLTTSAPGEPDCELAVVGIWVIVSVCSSAVLIAISLILFCLYYALKQDIIKLQVLDAINCVHSFEFPVVLTRASDFLEFKCMRSYEDLRDHGKLLILDTTDAMLNFKDTGKKYIFFSHQWACWTAPDTEDNIQYNCACTAVRYFIKRYDWCVDKVYIWLDFSSIPQKHQGTQKSAINALPMYSSLANLFVIVAPHIKHRDTGAPMDPESYRKRVWCRAEQVCHYCRHGRERMWLCSQNQVERVKEEWVTENFAIFSGECTCCTRKHKDMQSCDKNALVKPLLGLVAECYLLKESSKIAADVCNTLLGTKHIRNQMFPSTHCYNKEDKLIKKALFGNSIEWLMGNLGKSSHTSIKQSIEARWQEDEWLTMFVGVEESVSTITIV